MRMVGEADLAVTRTLSALVSTPAKLDPFAGLIDLDAVEPLEEIEMPPGAAEFAVGGELEADLLLLLDDFLDLAVFDRLERGGVDLASGRVSRAPLSAAPVRSRLPT